MLSIYYGRESTDREKFIFEHVKGKTLLLVPDQFSLQAERDAFFYLKKDSLMDLRIVDFSTLGHKVVQQMGGSVPDLVDKYGRHMLLTKVTAELEDELGIYKGQNRKNSFIDMLNSMISEMKRYDVTPDELEEAVGRLEENSYLSLKLRDILRVYRAYQEQIEGRYLDSEDYISFYGEKILEAPMIHESEIWIYGFDTFTPKNMQIIERLIMAARGVNIVMTYEAEKEQFELIGHVMEQLRRLAEQNGIPVQSAEIHGEERRTVWAAAAAAGDCSSGSAGCESAGAGRTAGESTARAAMTDFPITLTAASSMYAEAERAAAYILELVREKGFRYGDIVVVCNDTELRGGILRRVFMRWGIPVFMDKKRKVLHHQAVSFLLSLVEIIAKGYKDESMMRLIKSGMIAFTEDEKELLENYVKEFRIRGSAWKKDFEKCGDSYDEEQLNEINSLRRSIADCIENARLRMGARNTAGEKIRGLYAFLEQDMDVTERLRQIMQKQEDMGLAESAAETSQSWSVICNIFDQIVDIAGDEKISNEELFSLMKAGFEEIEIGLVPVTGDSVLIGTLQRTRLSQLRALLIVGANEGVLPLNRSDEGLLSEREKELLHSMEIEISKRDEITRQEEQLAIYRTLWLPAERLYVSCCGVNESGEESRPSEVFETLRDFVGSRYSQSMFGDLGEDGDISELITTRKSTLSYMAEALRGCGADGRIEPGWLDVMDWYEVNDAADFDRIKHGLSFDNRLEALGERFADSLYTGDRSALEVSASRLEQYSKCPFAHFVKYGLKAREPRVYEVGAREIGDVYHRCLMRLSQELTPGYNAAADSAPHGGLPIGGESVYDHESAADANLMNADFIEQNGHKAGNESGTAVCDAQSLWMTITEEECMERIRRIIREDMQSYREGLLSAGKEESYRAERIAEICGGIAWSMIQQVRKGRVKTMRFEYPFGTGRTLPPVRVDAGSREVLIQGTIDRLDILEGTGGESAAGDTPITAAAAASEKSGTDSRAAGESVRIIDYKTGGDTIDPEYFMKGYKLQLMVYLKAALEASHGRLEPAGVFYFKIRDIDLDDDKDAVAENKDVLEKKIADAYRLEGILLNDEGLINSMDGEIDGTSRVIPVKVSKKEGGYVSAAGGCLMSKEEFSELYEKVDMQVRRICTELCAGNIEIKPKREKRKDMEGNYMTACKYCSYRSICMFDTSFEGCRYENV